MSPFLERAEEILATARQARAPDCDMAILVARDGAVRFVPAEGWELEPLRLEHGAESAYRIERRQGRVRVEARGPHERCVLEAHSPRFAALLDFPPYLP